MEGEKERTCDGDGKKGRKTECMGKERRLKGGEKKRSKLEGEGREGMAVQVKGEKRKTEQGESREGK